MKHKHSPSAPAAIITAFGLLFMCALAIYALQSGWPLRFGDEAEYLQIASNLASGNGFQLNGLETARRPPAWPALISLLLITGAPHQSALLISALLIGGSGVLAGLLCVRTTSSPWGWLASPMVIGYPLNFYNGSTLYPQAFATFLLLAAWLTIARSTPPGSGQLRLDTVGGAALGAILSLCMLAVPTMAFTVAVISVFVAITHSRPRWRSLAAFCAGLTLPVIAWAVRNFLVFKRFIPLSTTSGENLYIGNNPAATAVSGYFDVTSRVPGLSGSEVERDAQLQSLALAWIRDHPLDAFTLWVGKSLNYFSGYSEPATAGQGNNLMTTVGWASLAILTALTLVRLVFRKTLPITRHEMLFLAIFVANAPVMGLFFTRTRFRQPLDSILICESVIALVILISRLSATRAAQRVPVTHADL